MRITALASEAEMVAVFLRAEIDSERWGEMIRQLLTRDGLNRVLIDTPNVNDAEENRRRAGVLGDFRGYGQNRSLFGGYPADGTVFWQWVMLDKSELARVRYIDYSYWNVLSGNTRFATVAVENVRRGVTSCGVPNDGFWKLAHALQEGARFPPLILVSDQVPDRAAPPIVLEGHVRLTAYLLAPESIPDELQVLWGTAPAFARW